MRFPFGLRRSSLCALSVMLLFGIVLSMDTQDVIRLGPISYVATAA